MQGKYNKRNSWIEISDETIPKPKIKEWIKWFPKHSQSFVPSRISEQGGLNFRKMDKGATNFGSHFLIFSYHCNWHWKWFLKVVVPGKNTLFRPYWLATFYFFSLNLDFDLFLSTRKYVSPDFWRNLFKLFSFNIYSLTNRLRACKS